MPIIHHSTRSNRDRVIVSLCDYSGAWCRPYVEAGYTVIQFDLKHGDDVTQYGRTVCAIADVLAVGAGTTRPYRVAGVLAAPPCTDFASSGARWWPSKDADGTTAQSVRIAEACIAIIRACKPEWWALENPVGRIARLVPGLAGVPVWYFDPVDYARRAVDPESERYTKKTGMWGSACRPATDRELHERRPDLFPSPLEPVMYEKRRKDGTVVRGSWMWANLGGKSERTKTLRSNTPLGFARAFASVNR
jgi:hypothetical protein